MAKPRDVTSFFARMSLSADDDGITKASEQSGVSKFFALKRDNAASARSRWHSSDNGGQQVRT
jgi:hypothetical protein